MRRHFLKSALAASASMVLSPLAFGQADWPNRPIRMLVPYPPGGAVDPIARVVGQGLSAALGQPIVVDNRPGANTALAAGALVKSEPDGYTLLFTSSNSHVVHTIQAPRGYDSIKDFAPVAAVSRGEYLMVIHPSVPAATLAEFIAYGKANPGKINAGAGSTGNEYLAAEMFKLVTGVNLTTVRYKGSAQALLDLLAGRTHMMITSRSLAQKQADAGKLRVLAYIQPPADRPSATTFAQAGLKGFETFTLTNMILAPRATPAPVVAKLTETIQRTLETPEVRSGIEAVSQIPFYLPPQALHDKLEADSARLGDLIRTAAIKFD